MRKPRAPYVESGATLSPCERYRYILWRTWDLAKPTIVFCGLNPSTADAQKDDATIRREVGFARAWGFGRMMKVNAYGWRATDPRAMLAAEDPFGPDNLATVLYWATSGALFVACWGNNIREIDSFRLRAKLRDAGVEVHALRLTKPGNPEHTLRLPGSVRPFALHTGKPWLQPKEIK